MKWRRFLYALIPLAVLLAGGEAGMRALDLPRQDPSRPFEHNEVFWVTPPDLAAQPWQHRETGRTFAVTTDAHGLRAPLHPVERAPGTVRVLFLGCSTTFGWGVDDDATYPARVQALLAERGRADVEILNGGQPGYTSLQGLWFYRTVARAYRPDVVVFGFVVQDARKAAYTDVSQAILQRDHRYLKDRLLDRSRLYLGLRDLVDRARVRAKERDEEGDAGVCRVPREQYVENIRAFADLARDDGFRLALFGFPGERAGYTEEHRRILAAAAEELHLPALDLQPEMDRLSRTATLYFPEDRGHANAEGHAVIADRVASFLESSGLLAGAAP